MCRSSEIKIRSSKINSGKSRTNSESTGVSTRKSRTTKKTHPTKDAVSNLSDYSSRLTSPVPNNLTSLNQSSSTVVLVNSPNQQLEADQGKPVELLNQLPNGTWHIKVKSGVKVIVKPEALKVLA